MPLKKFAAALFMATALGAAAQPAALDASLNETVQMVPKKAGLFTIELETTLYKPDGDGPFPIAIINHGRVIANEPTRELVSKAQEKAVVVTFDRDIASVPTNPSPP